jgi:hypothetical protein
MSGAVTYDVAAPPAGSVRLGGLTCLVAGVLGAASGIFLAAYPARGADDTWRYPLSADGFAAIQAWFGVQHLGLLAATLVLQASGLLGTSRSGRVGAWAASAGMALLTVTELLAISASDADLDQFAWLNTLYGVSTTLSGIGLVMAGITVRRSGRLPGWWSWVVLAAGAWVFVPMTPAIILDFLAARLAIAGWMLLYAAIGWLLWRGPDRT